MASRGRTSLSAPTRAKRAKGPGGKGANSKAANAKGPTGNSAGEDASLSPPSRIAPIYKRLPHGPHQLERNQVVIHQRSRIHGAMIQAVAQHGYEHTSVKQVIGLAGVSRRSFYEQFANKEECFLITFDLVVRRDVKQFRKLYLSTTGTLEHRFRVVFDHFAQSAKDDRNAVQLVVIEAPSAGPAGIRRVRRATGAVERLLAHAFAESPNSQPLPAPVIRGISGGLNGITSAFLRLPEDSSSHIDLSQEMLGWTLLFQTSTAPHMCERMSTMLNIRMREISSSYGHGLTGAEAPSRDERTRMMQAILRLVAREDYRQLSAPQIADEANLPVDTFCETFASKEDCYLQALDMIGDQLLAITADPKLVSPDWPRTVRRVLAQLMRYLADHPLQTRTLTQDAFFAGPEARQQILELSHGIATLLTEGAPAPATACNLTTEAIAGAIWHTTRSQVDAARIPLLAALSDHLTYIVLAPFIGADAAAHIVTEECPRLDTSSLDSHTVEGLDAPAERQDVAC
jgi:AcrR family transcriptional regulator